MLVLGGYTNCRGDENKCYRTRPACITTS
eukprot:SAG31_NODE_5910_length_2260_cov_2.581212_1_plen_28_part_10